MKHSGDCRRRGFTLIELSIVLVIIGLLVGGVLVGLDMTRSAGERGQITQIEKYQQAVNTFRGKFNALPGDMDAATASNFGFYPRGWGTAAGYQGAGDGNGLIEGSLNTNNPNTQAGFAICAGEPVAFWNDLTYANGMKINLVEGNFQLGMGNAGAWAADLFFPKAKIGAGNHIYAYSANGNNYFGISAGVGTNNYWRFFSNPALSVKNAYDIDQKIDDGQPQSGRVIAQYINANLTNVTWAAGGGVVGASPGATATPSATTCYDNSGNASAPMTYSISQNNGAGMNCALSIKFQ